MSNVNRPLLSEVAPKFAATQFAIAARRFYKWSLLKDPELLVADMLLSYTRPYYISQPTVCRLVD